VKPGVDYIMDFALKSDIGQLRQLNEDYCGYFYDNNVDLALFVLADGMGGHNAGEVASKLTGENIIKCIAEKYSSLDDPDNNMIDMIDASIQNTNNLVYGMADQNSRLLGMGTTLVLLALSGDKGYIANIGDSRAYLIDDLHINQLTTDHSYIEELVREGSISKEEARIHPKRNQITRAIGVGSEVVADYVTIDIKQETILLLCSDGLTNSIDENEIQQVVVSSESAEEASQRLLEMANQRGGYDNISVIVVKIL
jgi:protein phosphatase